jgi:hypothetical protein
MPNKPLVAIVDDDEPVPPEELCECVRSALGNRPEPKA